jgi:hypothetical protein
VKLFLKLSLRLIPDSIDVLIKLPLEFTFSLRLILLPVQVPDSRLLGTLDYFSLSLHVIEEYLVLLDERVLLLVEYGFKSTRLDYPRGVLSRIHSLQMFSKRVRFLDILGAMDTRPKISRA